MGSGRTKLTRYICFWWSAYLLTVLSLDPYACEVARMPSHISNAYRTNIPDDRTCQVFLRGSVFIRWCLLTLMLWTAQLSHKIPWALYSHDFLYYLYHTRHHCASIPSFLSGANLLSTILSPDSNGSSIHGIFEILYHEIDNFSTHTTPGDPPSVSAPSDDRKRRKTLHDRCYVNSTVTPLPSN